MYQISQFSKITGITVKALRYYDDEGVLKPSSRNQENQYRYYSNEDVNKALLLKRLRSFEFTIAEIREVIEHAETDEDITWILQEKIKRIEQNISKEQKVIETIRENAYFMDVKPIENAYHMECVEMKAMFVASIRFAGSYHEINTYIPQLYKAVKNKQNGPCMNCYFDEECVDQADMEVCVPIIKPVEDTSVICKTLPKIKALTTIHYGSYETLFNAYKALFAYANQRNLHILTPSREVYRKGPGMIFRGNPSRYITEILLPFEYRTKE